MAEIIEGLVVVDEGNEPELDFGCCWCLFTPYF
jgi:hypothetical protein